jgi:hypothetical protein
MQTFLDRGVFMSTLPQQRVLVARHAEGSGYSLEIAHNAEGRVCCVLSGAIKPPAEAPAASRLD